VILIKERPALFLPTNVSFRAGVRFPWPLVAIASFTISYGLGNVGNLF
jgi:hypothetical protein